MCEVTEVKLEYAELDVVGFVVQEEVARESGVGRERGADVEVEESDFLAMRMWGGGQEAALWNRDWEIQASVQDFRRELMRGWGGCFVRLSLMKRTVWRVSNEVW